MPSIVLTAKQATMHNPIKRPGKVLTFSKACANQKNLKQGKLIQVDMKKEGLQSNITAKYALINKYIRCGGLDEARQIFDHLPTRNAESCNTLIAGYAENGLYCQTLQVLERMQKEDLQPDSNTFVSILKACSKGKASNKVKLVHAEIIKNRLESDIFVGTSLVDAYAKCGNIIAARQVFDNLPNRNLVSWNTMISAYAQNGSGHQALELFEKMQEEDIKPDGISFVSALKACGLIRSIDKGKVIHYLIRKSSLDSDIIVGNSLVDMYMKCGSVLQGCDVFNKLPKRDVVSWNAIIGGHVRHGHGKQALQLFKNMEEEEVEPDNVTYVVILKACGSIGAIEDGILIHNKISRRQLESDVFVGTALMNMYAKCGKLFEARLVFEKLKVRNRVSWNAMIAGYVNHRLDKEAIKLFEEMQQNGVQPDKITFQSVLKACGRISLHEGRMIHRQVVNMGLESDMHIGSTLVDMYANFGSIHEAHKVFNEMLARDTVAWNALITGYAQQGSGLEVLQLFKVMKDEGIDPDGVTFVSVLKACGSMGDLENGKLVHTMVLKRKLGSDVYIGATIIDMYAKCGSLNDAKQVFDNLVERDLVAWNAMIAGYVQHGYGRQALELFKNMKEEGLKPDIFTFASVLKACGCIAALDQGKLIHAQIRESGLEPDLLVANNLVDMYAKCGQLDKAYDVFANLKRRDVTSWNALMAGCAHLGLGTHALKVFGEMLKDGVQPNDATFVCALSACSHANLPKDGVQIFDSMADFGIIPKWQHYSCMVDILSRAGNLLEAEEFIHKMPVQPDADMWMSLLGACSWEKKVAVRKEMESHLGSV
ncbi:hypothetical protein O6H91_11G077500 [Diphasiastrum complanatum]|uniref:Uncharacterized protein n=1 Tax=Diphasiastrum complanatum TaxID=34168 RepID=A0ACC2CAS4_DIPCM|nr:hypothetical protein O6H91_11G077500 [Diphasiastrum complanatum]